MPHFNIKTGLCRNTGKIVLTLLEATARVASPCHWIIPKNGTAPQERVDGKFSFRDGRDAEGGQVDAFIRLAPPPQERGVHPHPRKKYRQKTGFDTYFSKARTVNVFSKVFPNSPLLHLSTRGIIIKGYIITRITRKKWLSGQLTKVL